MSFDEEELHTVVAMLPASYILQFGLCKKIDERNITNKIEMFDIEGMAAVVAK